MLAPRVRIEHALLNFQRNPVSNAQTARVAVAQPVSALKCAFRHVVPRLDFECLRSYRKAGLLSWRGLLRSYRPPVAFFDFDLWDWRVTADTAVELAKTLLAPPFRRVLWLSRRRCGKIRLVQVETSDFPQPQQARAQVIQEVLELPLLNAQNLFHREDKEMPVGGDVRIERRRSCRGTPNQQAGGDIGGVDAVFGFLFSSIEQVQQVALGASTTTASGGRIKASNSL